MTPPKNGEIPQKLKGFIEKIPENGAVQVKKGTWEPISQKPRQIIAKINGRLEFIEYTNELDWETVYRWYFETDPDQWEEHFDLSDPLPVIVKKIYEVFI